LDAGVDFLLLLALCFLLHPLSIPSSLLPFTEYPLFCDFRSQGMTFKNLFEDRAVFKGAELRVQPRPEKLRKFFGNIKKHAQRNASAGALYVCSKLIVMSGKAIWRL